jgi:Transposase IS116/IS110/IS902 family
MMSENVESVARLSRDLAQAARTLSDDEARYLVDAYYQMQDDRKRAHNQVRAMDEEPHVTLVWLATQSETLENQIKRALDIYTDAHPVGGWLKNIYGIGPVIAAGLLAYIDIERAPTAGHIWRYAGLDPTSKWEKGKKRPWNAALKTICWKAGQSFMKFSTQEDCYYGQLYRERKAYEIQRNESGGNAESAAQILATKKFSAETETFKHLSAGRLPPAQIDARARRWTVKIFLSHLHAYWYRQHFGVEPPAPFPLAQLGHAHVIKPPFLLSEE